MLGLPRLWLLDLCLDGYLGSQRNLLADAEPHCPFSPYSLNPRKATQITCPVIASKPRKSGCCRPSLPKHSPPQSSRNAPGAAALDVANALGLELKRLALVMNAPIGLSVFFAGDLLLKASANRLPIGDFRTQLDWSSSTSSGSKGRSRWAGPLFGCRLNQRTGLPGRINLRFVDRKKACQGPNRAMTFGNMRMFIGSVLVGCFPILGLKHRSAADTR